MASAIPKKDVVRPDKGFSDLVWENFHEFYDQEKHIDVTFLWRSYPERITAHRVILAAASVYFDELFQTKQGSAPAIYIENIAPDEFELLIAYCYTGRLNPKMNNVSRLLNGATILKLDGAAALCTAYLKGSTERSRPLRIPAFQLPSNQPTSSNTNTNKSILAVRQSIGKQDTESCIYRCDEMEKIWIQCGVLKFPTQRAVLVYSNKRLITLGGISPQNLPMTCVHSCNLETQIWRKLPPMKVARVGLCAVAVDGIIYAIGGYMSPQYIATMTAEKFDPSTGQWTSVPSMCVSRAESTAVAIDHQIYIIGGVGIDREELKSVECYNIKTGKWRKCADMLQGRFNCGASVFKGLLYVISSGNTQPPYRSDVEFYDIKTDTWSQAPPVNIARSGICGVTLSDRLMAVGGSPSTEFKGIVEVYKPTRNTWMQVRPLPSSGNYSCFIIPTKELLTIGNKTKSPKVIKPFGQE
ncbi:PREDICTED: kelch-like protein 5 [Bactrocera latifrons]|uniref:Kelch-like protein 1 n=2 Tax=Bactrocera latifrons TaxID=174628 RepID=A0A0K8VCI0_BACLA|nr:PREDICTED: kelch-like protein 5 [Bactrocera latifrons]XP_018787208.1 PREDICTED: kelch-like protein 5 [Bactrocera latifrons]XP_018787209.1 PREDICTED: kelch-like protein 5 [Bactrocera latifrons]XP_018787210.1 PREDICTED: kelch-like protein 5 [Bactrocera latifrons]XP_018787211.1 PREDICTED: kelch-like protein 5 [Bactrocera latifrons]XP_018787212.1 PREDICTED: kelch-like protein 5 [Bactrocera latifrons]